MGLGQGKRMSHHQVKANGVVFERDNARPAQCVVPNFGGNFLGVTRDDPNKLGVPEIPPYP